MTLTLRTFLFISLLFLSATYTVSAQDAILGIWETAEKDGRFKIYKENGKYFGKLIYGNSMKDENGQAKIDTKNPDPKMSTRTWQDAVMLHDFVYDEDDKEYTDGQIYDLRYGKYYNAILRLRNQNNTLHVRGYVGFSLFGQTVEWHRIE